MNRCFWWGAWVSGGSQQQCFKIDCEWWCLEVDGGALMTDPPPLDLPVRNFVLWDSKAGAIICVIIHVEIYICKSQNYGCVARKLNRYFNSISFISIYCQLRSMWYFSSPPHPAEILCKEKNSTSRKRLILFTRLLWIQQVSSCCKWEESILSHLEFMCQMYYRDIWFEYIFKTNTHNNNK